MPAHPQPTVDSLLKAGAQVHPGEPWPSGTRGLSDAQFIGAMDGLTLPADAFRHYDHIRLAWIFLRESASDAGPDISVATDRMTRAIRRFAAHHGAIGKYHDTMTRAYMRFVAAHARMTPQLDDFAEFAIAHAELFDRALPLVYYSASRLMSANARARWVEPDLKPLPTCERCHSERSARAAHAESRNRTVPGRGTSLSG